MPSGGQVLHTLLYFIYLLLIESPGIDYKLYIGVVVSAMLLLIIAVIVTFVVTWRHGSGMSLVIVRTSRGGGNFSDRQVAACAQATVRKPSSLARSTSAQTAVTRRSKKDSDSLKRCAALGYRHSKSLNNLNAIGFEMNLSHGQLSHRNKPALSASCSALDLPLPRKPGRISTLYEDNENPRQSEFLGVNQNVAYTTSRDIDSRPPCPPPYSKSPQPSHLYEQLDLVHTSSF